MKNNKNYFTTGEFANLFNVKKQTLFHYDNIGIFKPEKISDNGYRYYSFTQIETFAFLTMLKELHVPLKEIKAHMDNRSPEALIQLLTSKNKEIEQKILDLQWSKKYINTKIQITKEGMKAEIGKCIFADIQGRYMITTDYSGKNDEKAAAEAVTNHLDFCHSVGINSAYAIGGIIPIKNITKQGYCYSKYYTIVDKEELDSSGYKGAIQENAGKILAYYDNHGYARIHDICLEIIDYAKKNNLQLGDFFYEDVILDDLSTNGYYNYLTKISIRVSE